MLEHGGDLQQAIRQYGREREAWIDLSTGINPHSYPVPALPPDIWHRLPEDSRPLIDAACAYYGAPDIMPVAGSQAAIQALPRLRRQMHGRSRVTVAQPAYSEHAHCWTQEGHQLQRMDYSALAVAVERSDVVVVCNPNNPTGAVAQPRQLLNWARHLAARGGWLIVDEAFGDMTPELSVAARSGQPGLIVLRSIGKFFGLAGLRLGFVGADRALLSALAGLLGPWTVSGAAQHIGCSALYDAQWQAAMRRELQDAGRRLRGLLQRHGIASSGTVLYQWWACPDNEAQAFGTHMARHGIWVRLFGEPAPGVRIGLPGNEAAWRALERALEEWNAKEKA